jgi:predicted nucleic acid-binding protein
MNYLLDTCVLSEFLKKQPDQNVTSWVAAQFEQSLYLSVLTIGEIQKGIARLPDSRRKTALADWLNGVIERYGFRILPIGIETAIVWGDLKAALENRGVLLPAIDSLIAATAIKHDLTIVSRNVTDFSPAGVDVLNIWE